MFFPACSHSRWMHVFPIVNFTIYLQANASFAFQTHHSHVAIYAGFFFFYFSFSFTFDLTLTFQSVHSDRRKTDMIRISTRAYVIEMQLRVLSPRQRYFMLHTPKLQNHRWRRRDKRLPSAAECNV